MTAIIEHRGPDGDGFFAGASVSNAWHVRFGFRRLAIIDLAGGNQPMDAGNGAAQLIYNGEIYNFKELRRTLESLGHVFRTSSDTEVLLKSYMQWKDECVHHIHGMFAFAIWDRDEDRLFIARDRFGKKPLYYFIDPDGGIVFASEINALLAHPSVPSRLDHESLRDLLAWRYVPGPHTMFNGIKKLPPASRMVWKNGKYDIDHYWTPPDALVAPGTGVPIDDPVAEFESLLSQAVNARLVSDVPFGAFLSGGLDSSSIVAIMREHMRGENIKTFSVGFDRPDYSELQYAKEVADLLKTDHCELIVTSSDIPRLLPHLTQIRGAPVAEPADVAIFCLAQEASKSVKMVLSGEGADELLGGYPKHWAEPYAHDYQRFLPAWLRRRAIEPLVYSLPFKYRRIKTILKCWEIEESEQRLPRWFGGLTQAEADRLIRIPYDDRKIDERIFQCREDTSALRRLLYFDQSSWLPDNLLERGDSMTMAASIEARMPFMDDRLYDFMARIPDSWRIRGTVGKKILRQVMRNRLPDSILHRPKVGFRVPVDEWFMSELDGWVRDLLFNPNSQTRIWGDIKEIEKIFEDHVQKRQNNEKTLWMLVALELFLLQFKPQI